MTNELLLDTNIVTYTSGISTWRDMYEPVIHGKRLFICFMTLAELLEKILRKDMSANNVAKYKEMIQSRYVVLPWNEEICDRFAIIRAGRRNRPIPVADALIAATAMTYGLPLVTHNMKDFMEIDGLDIITKYR